jgi:hypothetical protein
MTGPEVIDTIAQVSGRMYKFEFLSGVAERLKQLTVVSDVPGGRRSANGAEGADISSIMNSFFSTNRQNAVQAGNRPTALQAMLMMSTGLVKDRVLAEEGSRVHGLLEAGKTNDELIDEVYLAILSRWPTNLEKEKVLEAFPFSTDRKHAAENLQWGLLNSIEYLLNH